MTVPVDITRRHSQLDDIGSLYTRHPVKTLSDAMRILMKA